MILEIFKLVIEGFEEDLTEEDVNLLHGLMEENPNLGVDFTDFGSILIRWYDNNQKHTNVNTVTKIFKYEEEF